MTAPRDITLPGPADAEAWRAAARRLLAAGVPPDRVGWRVAGDPPGLFPPGAPPPAPAPDAPPITVPRGFPALAEVAIRHRDPTRFDLLYRILWRLTRGGERGLLDTPTDPDILRAEALAKAVRRDAHKMHAFVRFRAVTLADGPNYVAWFEPDHHILAAEAGFFVRRFAGMRWSILTPTASAHWDTQVLRLGPGGRRQDAPAEDATEDLWRAYFASIFNPARLKPAAMRAEMPEKYWRNLPEAQDIPRLMAEAPARVAEMVARGATPPAPRRQRSEPRPPVEVAAGMDLDLAPAADDPAAALAALARSLAADPGLPGWTARATQPVFGEGPPGAALMFVGEQPGDEEDLAGRPFIGPAGRLLDRALAEAGIDRCTAYVTNAVKHFKYVPTGRRRLHQSPDAGDIAFYRPFLRREVALVAPRLVVALGATALRALTGKPLAVGKSRGAVLPAGEAGRPIFPTIHPSYLLRLPDPEARDREYARFIAELGAAAQAAAPQSAA